ncbi:MAG: hypothetical protein D4R72_05445 [Nitrosopumilales archaeon]|nr:MAG: hypothetical protein D4R72_05445 [Nitrosopumilales archaeon]
MIENLPVKEMIEQVCLSLALRGSNRDPTNRFALTILNNTVQIILKFYAASHGLLKGTEINSQEAFVSILDKIKDQNKIVNYEKKDIIKYNKILDEFHIKDNFKIEDNVIDEYVILAKILLARLYDYRASKIEWEKMIEEVRRHA